MKDQTRNRLRALCACALVSMAALPLFAAGITCSPEDTARLVQAIETGHIDTVRFLVTHCIDVNTHIEGDGTPLIAAARRGDLDMVDSLIHMGADVNQPATGDGSPLIAAAAHGHLAVVAHLIAAGASVNAIVPDDETPLINAVRCSCLAVVKYLVAHGADVNLGVMADGSRWRTPMNQARSVAIRDFLVTHGAVPQAAPVTPTASQPISSL